MAFNSKASRTLEKLLEQELVLYEQYVAVLKKEQDCIVRLKSDEVSQYSEKRHEITDKLGELKDRRLELTASFSDEYDEPIRLSEIVEIMEEPRDKHMLESLIQKIKDAVACVERATSEFSQVLQFSLGMVNGEISLLWSASQNVNRVYNSFGTVQEAVEPSAPRTGSLLGQA